MGPTFLAVKVGHRRVGGIRRFVGAGMVSGDHFGLGGLQVVRLVSA